MARPVSEMKRQGWRAIPTHRKASDILTSTVAAFLFSSHPKREKDREAHLNYYTSADNRERQPSHHKTKQEAFEKCWAHSPLRAVARRLRIDVHNNNNDNA